MCNTWYYIWRQNVKEKYSKVSCRTYKYIMQQIVQEKVQQNVHNNHVALLIKRFVFTTLVESLY